MSELTGNRDVDLKILAELDDDSLLNFCQIKNQYVKKLCTNEYFWINRLYKVFGKVAKSQTRKTWRNLYLSLVYYTDKYLNKPNYENYDLIKEIASKNDIDVLNYLMAFKGFNNWRVGILAAIDESLRVDGRENPADVLGCRVWLGSGDGLSVGVLENWRLRFD